MPAYEEPSVEEASETIVSWKDVTWRDYLLSRPLARSFKTYRNMESEFGWGQGVSESFIVADDVRRNHGYEIFNTKGNKGPTSQQNEFLKRRKQLKRRYSGSGHKEVDKW